MGENSNISWCDHTFNPWEGCTKVSPGCTNCYAEARNQRFAKGANWGPGKPRRRTSAANWRKPLQWNRHGLPCNCGADRTGPTAEAHNGNCPAARRPRVFCASLADWLDDEVPIEWLADLMTLVLRKTTDLDWLLLTKRPELWRTRLIACIQRTHCDPTDTNDLIASWLDGERIPTNVRIGTSIENQKYADVRIPDLLKIPAKSHFLSAEPLLGDIDFRGSSIMPGFAKCTACGAINKYPRVGLPECACGASGRGAHRAWSVLEDINWVICGGESGPGHRPMNIDHLRSLYEQTKSAGAYFFSKQDSGPKPGQQGRIPDDLWTHQFPE